MGKVTRALAVQLRSQSVAFRWFCECRQLKAGGMGSLGSEQLEWLEDDLKGTLPAPRLFSMRTSAVDIIQIGAGNDDSEQALSYVNVSVP